MLRGALEILDARPAHFQTGVCRRDLGACLLELERHDEAERELLQAYSILSAKHVDWHPDVESTIQRLVELYDAMDEPARAAPWQAKLLDGWSTP